MERAITGYHRDDQGDWVAELACGHDQHVRHRPPFQIRPWVMSAPGRAGRLGSPLDCPRCDRAELPEAIRWVRTTPVWDRHTVPAGLRRAHRIASGTWGSITVEHGRLRFGAQTTPPVDVVLEPGSAQPIPPDVDHEVEPLDDVRFRVEFFVVDRDATDRPNVSEEDEPSDEGGDPACWAGIVCPDCGGLAREGSHRDGCPRST